MKLKRLDRDAVLHYMIARIFFLLGLLPRGSAIRISNVLGRIWFAVDRRHRLVAVSNLTTAFGDQMTPAEIRPMARRIFCNLTRIIFEIGWSLHVRPADIQKYFRFYGMHHLRQALRRNKGVLILTAHIGNWELLIMAAGMIGMPINAIYRPLDFSPLDRFFNELRSRNDAKLFPKKRAMRGVLRALKNNELIGILMDQNTNVFAGVFADFFGVPACTNKGMALLARETGAPVVPLFLVREGGGYRVEFQSELPLIKTRDKTRDIEVNTNTYNMVIENFIRRYPEQWFWVHRRWKTKPYQKWEPEVSGR